MNVFAQLIREARLAYYEWAIREMPPHHPDLSLVLQRRAQLLDERHRELQDRLREQKRKRYYR